MRRPYRLLLLIAASLCTGALLLTSATDTAAVATTFTVNSSADPGDGVCDATECTLREAIDAANANVGKDTIEFDISGAGPHTIQPATDLPVIGESAVLDATTQPGYLGAPLIVLDGSSAGTGTGFRLAVADSELAGFQIVNFRTGVTLDAAGNVIRANYFGTDGTTTPAPGIQEFGIRTVSGNLIGGSTSSDRNVISGNDVGVFIEGDSNTIVGNYFGTNGDGSAPLENGLDIFGLNASNNAIGGSLAGERNVIASDVRLTGGSGNSILGNFIGIDAAGSSLLSSLGERVVLSGATETRIGGDSSGEGNVIAGGSAAIALDTGGSAEIAGNLIGTDHTGMTFLGVEDGIVTEEDSGPVIIGGTTPGARNVITSARTAVSLGRGSNIVQGNYIGTNATGTAQLGGTSLGGNAIVMDGIGNVVGGLGPGEGNLIAGKFFGVIVGGTSGDVRVDGNLIGTQADGETPLGSLGPGILIAAIPDCFTVDFLGNPLARITENTIANNGRGVIVSDSSRQVVIRSNSIHSNSELGIDLNPPGVNTNDLGDADAGANEGQNYPDLDAADQFGVETRVTGTLSSQPSTTYTLEFFASAECDVSGFGEGERSLGLVDVTTSQANQVGFSVSLSSPVDVGEFITATATDPDDNTSEFSACVPVTDDADGDGVPNEQDACPDLAGPADNDGCPLPGPPAVGGIAGVLSGPNSGPAADSSGQRSAVLPIAAAVAAISLTGGSAWLLVRRRRG